jgi:predicted Zn-dependent protease
MKEESKVPFAAALKLKKKRRLASARKVLLELSRKDRKSIAILLVLGGVCWDMGLLNEAVRTFKRATRLAPTLEIASLGVFHSLWELGEEAQALKEIHRFMTVSDSRDYREIIREIHRKYVASPKRKRVRKR